MAAAPEKPEYLRIKEAAQMLGVNPRTVYRRIQRGELPASKVGGLYLIGRADLEGLLADGAQTGGAQTAETDQAAPYLRCGYCYRLLLSDAQVGEVCRAESCDELLCTACVTEGMQHCARHAPDRQSRWQEALERRERGEIPVLVRASTARLREINFLGRIRARLAGIGTLAHPHSGEALAVNWEAALQQNDQRAEVMRLMGQVYLEAETLERLPLNAALHYQITPPRKSQTAPLAVQVQALSRLDAMVRDGYDTQPLGEEDLSSWLAKTGGKTSAPLVRLVVLAATTGWDEPTRNALLGGEAGPGLALPNLLVYLFDLERGELLYNSIDERARSYAGLFVPLLPEEELAEAVRAVEKELLIHESLTLNQAAETLPYPRQRLEQAFEKMAAAGRYTLMDVPELGQTIVRR